MNNTPDSPAQTPDDRMTQGGNYWTLFTPGIWKDLHAVSETALRALADSGAIRRDAKVQFVTTKCDLLPDKGAADALEALTEFEHRLVATHAGRFEAVTSFRTAARDPRGMIEPVWGVARLLQSWLALRAAAVPAAAPLPELSDEFDRLLVRRTA